MRFLLTLFLLLPLTLGATVYTEFFVQSTGSNLNSGHTTDDAATYTGTGGNWTNNTSATTGTWFKTGESLAAVTNGAWAALYTDGTTTNAQFVGLVTAVSDANDTITLSLQNYCGANPSTVVAGMSIKVGGAWKGFTTNTMANGGGFPLNFLSNTATNAQNVFPRCNIKSGTTYNVASAITHANTGPCTFEGYTTSVGDGGRPTIDGGATGTSYILLTVSGSQTILKNLIFANNGNSGSANLLSIGGASVLIGVVVHDSHRSGFVTSGTSVSLIECEAYACDKANTAGHAGFLINQARTFLSRCISHDNSSANAVGFIVAEGTILNDCIADSNGSDGFRIGTTTAIVGLNGCDSYNNGASGLDDTSASSHPLLIQNCNFIKNATFGITSSGSSMRGGLIYNCGFGSGTETNASGNLGSGLNALPELSTKTYAADYTPWSDPANGNFSIALTAAKAAGRGAFTQTAASYTGTVGYPDIGSAQSASTNSASSGGAYTWSQ